MTVCAGIQDSKKVVIPNVEGWTNIIMFYEYGSNVVVEWYHCGLNQEKY